MSSKYWKLRESAALCQYFNSTQMQTMACNWSIFKYWILIGWIWHKHHLFYNISFNAANKTNSNALKLQRQMCPTEFQGNFNFSISRSVIGHLKTKLRSHWLILTCKYIFTDHSVWWSHVEWRLTPCNYLSISTFHQKSIINCPVSINKVLFFKKKEWQKEINTFIRLKSNVAI